MRLLATAIAMAAFAGTALAQTPPAPGPAGPQAPKTIGQPAKPVILPSLLVFNSRGATLQGQKLVLTGVSPNTVVFADRPVRGAGHDLTSHIVEDWSAGGNSFARNPPNATVSVFSKDAAGLRDAVVVLKSPKLAGDTLSFDVDVIEGDIAGADGAASVFIDIVGLPWTPASYASMVRWTARRAAWYRSAPAYSPYSYVASAPAGAKTIGVPAKQAKVDSLIVLNAAGARLNGQTLTIDKPQADAVLFTDRPVRGAGHVSTSQLFELWKTGSFAKDPPNATVSVFSADGSSVKDAVVVLKQPKLSDGNLTFEVAVLEGDLGKADGPASIFIDTIWFGVGGGQGIQYLGRNYSSGGGDPAIGSADSTSAMTGWSNPAPNAPPPPRYYPGNPGMATPPELGGDSVNYRGACGAPPLLPCY